MPVGYGKKIREGVRKAEQKAKQAYECPSCSRNAVRRIAPAIWQCGKCSTKFASGSYEFRA